MSLIRTTPSSAPQAPPRTSAEGGCEAMPSQGVMLCPTASPSPNPTAPMSLPSRRLTPGPAGAGTGAGNWKGELQSTKSYQQAAGESSAAILGEPGPRSGAGWQPFVRWHGADTHGSSCSEWALPWLKWEGCSAGAAESGTGSGNRHSAALGASTLAGCFRGSLRHGFLASEVPPAASVCAQK